MGNFEDQNRAALMSCIEVVIMRRNGVNYQLIQAKLKSLYNCTVADCYENPKYLRTVLKDVYKESYDSIIDEIKFELGELVNMKEIVNYLKIMES